MDYSLREFGSWVGGCEMIYKLQSRQSLCQQKKRVTKIITGCSNLCRREWVWRWPRKNWASRIINSNGWDCFLENCSLHFVWSFDFRICLFVVLAQEKSKWKHHTLICRRERYMDAGKEAESGITRKDISSSTTRTVSYCCGSNTHLHSGWSLQLFLLSTSSCLACRFHCCYII